jgi:hypothetical protein
VGFLKGFGTAICSLLLFLALTIFSIAFLVHSTVLSADFVTDQVDKLDVSAIVHDIADEMLGEQLPEEAQFLADPVYEIIDAQEPWLKEQVNSAIYTLYDYMLGKTDRLEVVIPMEDIKADLKDSLWNAINEKAGEWLPEVVGDELWPFVNEHLDEFADQIPEDLLPPEVAALPGENLKPYLQEYLADIEEQIEVEMSRPEISGLLEELIKPYYDQYYEDFISQVPSEFVLDEEEIPADVMEQLQMAREYIGYFQTGYWLLIVFMVVMALLIFLINRNVRDTTRALGIDLLIFGILDLAGVLIIRGFNPMQYITDSADIPASLETWITGLFNDFLNPMLTFSIIILAVGIILLVVSFVYRRGTAEDI